MKNTQSLYAALASLGISHSQGRLYIEFLKSGPLAIAQAARQLNTSRQAIYLLLLPELLQRGLVKEIAHGKRSLYQALPPTQFYVVLEKTKEDLESIVPLLTNLQNTPTEVPLVTIYDSPISMREWYRNFLESAEPGDDFYLYSSGNLSNWYGLDEKFYKNYMEIQVKRAINVYCLINSNKEGREHKETVGWSVREYRYTNVQLSSNVEQWIWRDQICYLTIQGNSSSLILLQSAGLADFSRKQFKEIWEKAEKI